MNRYEWVRAASDGNAELGMGLDVNPRRDMTETVLGELRHKSLLDPDLHASAVAVERLGEYPAPYSHLATGKGRLFPVTCPHCGYTVRVARMWLNAGLPVCPCGTSEPMALVEGDGSNASA